MIVKLLVVAAAIAVAVWLWREMIGGTREAPFPCKTCRHCRKLFDDGVRCGYGAKETFKNPAQIGMCHDYERR